MEPFSPRLLLITDGSPTALRPVPFQGRVDELTLERWIVDNPDLVGEQLLVLGHQLADLRRIAIGSTSWRWTGLARWCWSS
jgi:hypothetical protein